jgi:protein-tyrosine phosphatase
VFVDVHSHVVPSGDDGVETAAEGLALAREAARRGTRVLFATPHVWPHTPLTPEREQAIRAAHARMAAEALTFGLHLGLGFELTPAPALLEEELRRYRLGGLEAVLMEFPFSGGLALLARLVEALQASGLVPVLAHPERTEAVLADPDAARRFAERGCLVQVNATSLLGDHGPERERLAWELLEDGVASLVASDGHRPARPPFLDSAYEAVSARLGSGAADALFDGRALPGLAARDRVHLAERR